MDFFILVDNLFVIISLYLSVNLSIKFSINLYIYLFIGEGAVISKREQRILFSEAIQVRACSERFLADLESAWQESVLLDSIPEIIRFHAKNHFQVSFNGAFTYLNY